jgi:hypothetical protein
MVQQVLPWLAANWFSLLQTVSIITGLIVVAKNQRESTRQRQKEMVKRESESLDKILDGNQQLVILAFSHPQLFAILRDAPEADADMEKCHLQLWLNQFSRVHSYLRNKVFRNEQIVNLERSIQDFMLKQNMQRHWQQCRLYYPASFQQYITAMLQKNEPPPAAAHQDTD